MASNQDAIEESLRSLLNCNICKQEVDELKVLPCQHTVCLPCAKQLNVVKRKFTCSVCNKQHPMPNGGVGKLPDSLVGKQLKDLIKSKKLSDAGGEEAEDKVQGTDCTQPSEAAEESPDLSIKSEAEMKPSASPPSAKELLSNGGFGVVPPRSNSTKSDPETTKSKETELKKDETKPKPAVEQPVRVDAKAVKKLVKEIKDELKSADVWLMEAFQTMMKYKLILEDMPNQAKSTKKVYQDHQKTLKKLSFEVKLKGLDAALAERTEYNKATLKVMDAFATKMKNALEAVPKYRLRQPRYKRKSSSDFSEKVRKQKASFEQLKALNKEFEELQELGCSNYIRGGDYVRLATLNETEAMPYSETMNVSSDARIENILDNKVTHTSVGRYLNMILCPGDKRVLRAVFPEQIDWKGLAGSLVKCQKKVSLPYIGDKVKIKPSVTKPHFSWNGIRQKRCKGTLIEIETEGPANDVIVIVNFPENHEWKGLYSEIELAPSCGLEVGDEVRVNSNIPEPSRGWAGVNGSSVGKITAIEGPEGQEEATVDFPECKDWVGLATELEMSREPIKGEKVQVKLTVETPKLGWGGATHEDVGKLVEKVESSRGSGRIGNVKFPGKPERPFQIKDLEPARYQPPSYEESSGLDFHTLLYMQMMAERQELARQQRMEMLRNQYFFNRRSFWDDDY